MILSDMGQRKYDYEQVRKLYESGISYLEIAEIIGAPSKGAVESLLYKCGISKRKVHKQKQGESHNMAKLTEKQAIEIILLYNDGGDANLIAEKYHIHPNYVREIHKGKSWPHLSEYRKPRVKNKRR